MPWVNIKNLWWTLIAILAITFGILGYFGKEVYRVAPPIPDQVVSAQGDLIMTNEDLLNGQTAYQSVGGMQLGSIWGHGVPIKHPTDSGTGSVVNCWHG